MDRTRWNAEFAERFAKHEKELKQLYAGLYRNDENAWNYFVDMIWAAYEARPESLRMMDRAR